MGRKTYTCENATEIPEWDQVTFNTYTWRHAYRYYRKCYESEDEKITGMTDYTGTLRQFFRNLWKITIEDTKEFRLPNLGTFLVLEKDITNEIKEGRGPRWKRYYIDEEGKRRVEWVEEDNLHTNGKLFLIRWERYTAKFKHKSMYNFTPCIYAKGLLKDTIRERSQNPDVPDYSANLYFT